MKKLLLILSLSLFFLPLATYAITISPLVLEIALDPGASTRKVITLYNESNRDLWLNGFIQVFKPKNENGQPEFLKPDVAYQAVSWVKMPLTSTALKPGEAVEMPVIISVPKTAQVGGYYLAAMWETVSGKAGENPVGISSRVGALILLTVNGEAREKINILNFNLKNKNFYSRLPVDFSARLENAGNIHLKPGGYLTVVNMFGRVAVNLPFNAEGGNILPQSVRKFDNIWQKKNPPVNPGFWREVIAEIEQFAFGRYTAQLNLEYGENRERLSSQRVVFWVVPWRLITLMAVIILLIFLWRRRKKRIKNAKLEIGN